MRILFLLLLNFLFSFTGTTQFAPVSDTISGHSRATRLFKKTNAATPFKSLFDSSSLEVRSFGNNAIKAYKADRDFQYEQQPEPPRSWWDRLWSWFWFKVGEFVSTPEGENAMWILGTIAAVAILTYFVLNVTGMNRTGLFGKEQKKLAFTFDAENIHEISFSEAIEKAIAEANYRLALRLLYLQTLKQLSDKSLIDWQINKTNNDYLNETSGKTWIGLFRKLTFSFEYAWYGEVPLDKEHFSGLHQQFSELHNQLGT